MQINWFVADEAITTIHHILNLEGAGDDGFSDWLNYYVYQVLAFEQEKKELK